jgi:hypothetical protein
VNFFLRRRNTAAGSIELLGMASVCVPPGSHGCFIRYCAEANRAPIAAAASSE